MILLIHVIIALASVVLASVTFFKPSIKRLGTSYGLIVATIASGTLLLLTSPDNILKACLSGLCYVTAVTLITIATHIRAKRTAQLPVEK